MRPFSYVSAPDVATALRTVADDPGAKFLGGGTNLVDLMRTGIERPDTVVDITSLPLAEVEERPDGGVRIGALVRNSRLAAHPLIRARYPVLSQAVLAGASAQLRNMATVGGNLLQRTRCPYFHDRTAACNKREPGSGCDAIGGFNRSHAVLGVSGACIAAHPSDMCVALAALDAVVEVESVRGVRRVPLASFHRPPGETPHVETGLSPDELVTAVELPPSPLAANSCYRKVRDRASYAFALVSVAAALEVRGGTVTGVGLALGGVATTPWRAREAERALLGAPATEESFRRAAEAELASATGLPGNAFKIDMARRAVTATLRRLLTEGSPA
ncbi:FAD binding domain-containing protein [Planomonospora parontospora]|uniref:FAD binding domain-containing protein n=1 Tax=Planomonospora parontospora TaxID=58119 RepID=UPI001671510A|nr:xanthine dehydrogenase family protein subunit M [Planomonospora parontospora]GGL50924.1 carbon-monoxide dehydrogenase medium subunit [Planomonospora parontospora subsp. antibiotica]GII19034.1 carbon-monoxide dehydrogenase medium subunit [Planomonospora parontospora subsp. antibiotica]